MLVLSMVLVVLGMTAPHGAWAGDEEKQLLGNVVSGLLGQPVASPEQAYTAKERDRLVSMLQSGEYVTSRQGESVDLMVYGIPLTHRDHVYTARPVPVSQTSFGQQ